jgi:hypothetical protein
MKKLSAHTVNDGGAMCVLSRGRQTSGKMKVGFKDSYVYWYIRYK